MAEARREREVASKILAEAEKSAAEIVEAARIKAGALEAGRTATIRDLDAQIVYKHAEYEDVVKRSNIVASELKAIQAEIAQLRAKFGS
jgi:uncharacterized protein YfkK (UPF0435 family)